MIIEIDKKRKLKVEILKKKEDITKLIIEKVRKI